MTIKDVILHLFLIEIIFFMYITTDVTHLNLTAMYIEEQQPSYTYSGVITKPCQKCGKPVEVSPRNASWINSGVTCLTKMEFTLVAPCHSCGNINSYVHFMKKSDLKKHNGVEEV